MHISICLYLMLPWSLSNTEKRCAINWRDCEANFAPRCARPRLQSNSFCTFNCLEFWVGFYIESYSSIINYQAFNPLYSSSSSIRPPAFPSSPPPSFLPFRHPSNPPLSSFHPFPADFTAQDLLFLSWMVWV